ncbi:MAG: hypothetical protein KDJ90_00615 [Nitratireductor sp.]|nr:hypothetical protein [Nitratireductor sp.]
MADARRIAKIERRIGKAVAGNDLHEVAAATSTFMANFARNLGGDRIMQMQCIDALSRDAKELVLKRAARHPTGQD